jgi:hypothetical protein
MPRYHEKGLQAFHPNRGTSSPSCHLGNRHGIHFHHCQVAVSCHPARGQESHPGMPQRPPVGPHRTTAPHLPQYHVAHPMGHYRSAATLFFFATSSHRHLFHCPRVASKASLSHIKLASRRLLTNQNVYPALSHTSLRVACHCHCLFMNLNVCQALSIHTSSLLMSGSLPHQPRLALLAHEPECMSGSLPHHARRRLLMNQNSGKHLKASSTLKLPLRLPKKVKSQLSLQTNGRCISARPCYAVHITFTSFSSFHQHCSRFHKNDTNGCHGLRNCQWTAHVPRPLWTTETADMDLCVPYFHPPQP